MHIGNHYPGRDRAPHQGVRHASVTPRIGHHRSDSCSIDAGSAFSKGQVYDGESYRDFKSTAWTVGPSVGIDGSYEIGRWKVDNSGFAGDAQGVAIGLAGIVGASVTFWWNMDGDYIGWVVAPQGGASVEAEYIAGRTALL